MKNEIRLKTAASALFALIAVALLWVAGLSPYELAMSAWWPVIMVVEYSLILLWFTSIPFDYVLLSMGLGASIVPAVTFAAQKLMNTLLDGSRLQGILSSERFFGTIHLQTPFVAPVTEELLKLIPVAVILIFLIKYKRYRLLSPLDFALLGIAAGAGFDIFENLCRIFNDYYDVIGLYRSPINEPVPAFLSYLFPCMIRSEYLGNPMVWFGHAGTTGAISLAIGYCLYLKKKGLLVVPALVYAVCAFDHSMWNWYQPFPQQSWAKILPALTLYGRLVPLLFLIGILAACYFVGRQRKEFARELAKMPVSDAKANLWDKVKTAITENKRKNQAANALRHYIKCGIKGEEFDLIVSRLLGLDLGLNTALFNKFVDST